MVENRVCKYSRLKCIFALYNVGELCPMLRYSMLPYAQQS